MEIMSDNNRRELGKRIKEALAARRAEGLNVGRPRRIDPEAEALIVLRRSEGASIRRIAAELEAAGFHTPGAQIWHHSTVQRVVDRHPELAPGRNPLSLALWGPGGAAQTDQRSVTRRLRASEARPVLGGGLNR
jgi:hypothetical protein